MISCNPDCSGLLEKCMLGDKSDVDTYSGRLLVLGYLSCLGKASFFSIILWQETYPKKIFMEDPRATELLCKPSARCDLDIRGLIELLILLE